MLRGMTHPAVDAWRSRGRFLDTGAGRIFMIDQPPAEESGAPPVLVLHGFPSASFDWRHVLDRLAERRRVVLFDFLGFGLSDKPDIRYSIEQQAEIAQQVAGDVRLERVALVTHDMGDTVGGELLARSLDGALPFEVVDRVLTNGSIYIDMAHLTPGQELLLSLPDECLPADQPPEQWKPAFSSGLASTFSPGYPPSDDELDAQWELAATGDGYRLLPRLIRYVEDRRANERRYTGAIERHPSPLGVVWGRLDPVAVVAMTATLAEARPDAAVVTLDDVGHYPMIEAPNRFADAVLDHLDHLDHLS
jgi:pimeloyl-ACP methyl ester carboxylesterase